MGRECVRTPSSFPGGTRFDTGLRGSGRGCSVGWRVSYLPCPVGPLPSRASQTSPWNTLFPLKSLSPGLLLEHLTQTVQPRSPGMALWNWIAHRASSSEEPRPLRVGWPQSQGAAAVLAGQRGAGRTEGGRWLGPPLWHRRWPQRSF